MSVGRLVDARASGVILASAAVERRIAELRAAGHDEYAAVRLAFEELSPPSPDERLAAAQARTVGAMQLNASLGVRRKGGRVPRQPWIEGIEVDYASAIIRVVDGWRDEFAEAATALPRLVAASNVRRRDDLAELHLDVFEDRWAKRYQWAPLLFASSLDRFDADEVVTARRILAVMREKMEGEVNKRNLSAMAKYFGERTNREQRAALAKQLSRILGVEVIPDDRWIPEMVEYFAAENAELIGSIPRRLHDDIAQLTMRAFSKRMTPETYAEHLEEKFGTARSRARLIARDQLGSLYGQINQTRQTALGITHFYWETRKDNRVRPEHRRRQGKRYAWAEVSPDEIPGAPIACRCGAIPDLGTLLAMYKQATPPTYRRRR